MTAGWWQEGVLYQIYPRSFADSDGDGIGDLRGIIERLDYLEWLGVDGVWLSPITVSPNVDFGYDVADYCDVQPEFGTLADFDEVVAEAGQRGIRILLDFVPNHTSDRHPWFVDARSSRTAWHRDFYVWADPRQDGSPPNNWVSGFGGSAWCPDGVTGQVYLHNFAVEQPDLNWWNEEVREAFDGIQRFWLDRGVAGFRIDMCHMVIKDARLRDNPAATPDDHYVARLLGQRQVYNSNQPEVHDVVRRWRKLADSYDPPRLLLGETVVHDLADLVRFYGNGNDELHLPMNIPFLEADFDAVSLRSIVETTRSLLPPGAWPVWAGSNHDVSRMATRWAGNDPAKARLALLMLMTLRGTPLLYQGDEIGLPDTALEKSDLVDPIGLMLWPDHPGRDPARTPMPWEDRPGAGFTAPGIKPWLPFGDVAARNVTGQRDDRDSILNFARDLIALRRRNPELRLGDYAPIPSPDGVWAWRRGRDVIIALNLADEESSLPIQRGRVAIGTDRRRDGAHVAGRVELSPWEGLVIIDE